MRLQRFREHRVTDHGKRDQHPSAWYRDNNQRGKKERKARRREPIDRRLRNPDHHAADRQVLSLGGSTSSRRIAATPLRMIRARTVTALRD